MREEYFLTNSNVALVVECTESKSEMEKTEVEFLKVQMTAQIRVIWT